MYESIPKGGAMKDLKTWLNKNCAFRDYDDPDVDPDIVVSNHRKAVTTARSALRDYLKQQLAVAIEKFHAEDRPPEKSLLS